MNKIYKSVRNHSTGECVVASELAKGKVKSSSVVKYVCLVGGVLLSSHVNAAAGVVVDGSGEISGSVTSADIASGIYDQMQTGSPDYAIISVNNGGQLNIADNAEIVIPVTEISRAGLLIRGKDSTVTIGNNFSITSTAHGLAISGVGLSKNPYIETTGNIVNVGDNLKITVLRTNLKSQGTAITIQNSLENNVLNIGKNLEVDSAGIGVELVGANIINIDSGAVIKAGTDAIVVGATNLAKINGSAGGSLTLTEATLSSTGTSVIRNTGYGGNVLNLINSNINASDNNLSIFAINDSVDPNSDPNIIDFNKTASNHFIITGGIINAGNADLIGSAAGASQRPNAAPYLDIDFIGVEINGSGNGKLIDLGTSGKYAQGPTGGVTVNLNNTDASSLNGFDNTASSNLKVNLSNGSKAQGNGTNNGTGSVQLTVDSNSHYSGDLQNNKNGTLIGNITNGGTITGEVVNNDSGKIDLNIDTNGILNGDLTNNSSGTINSTINNGGTINGNINNNAAGNINLDVNSGGILNGNVSNNGSGNLEMNVNEGATWSGTGNNIGLWVKTNSSHLAVNDSSRFVWVNIDDNGTLHFGQPKNTLTRSAPYSSFKSFLSTSDMTQTDGGVANIIMSTNLGLGKGDLVAVDGTISGNYQVNINNYGGAPSAPNQSLRIIQGGTGSNAQVALTGNQYRDAGMYRYYLVQDSSGTGYWLVNGDGTGTSFGGGDDDISKSGNAYNADGSFSSFVPPAGFNAQAQTSDLAHTLSGTSAAQLISLLNASSYVPSHMAERRTGQHNSGLWLTNVYSDTRVNNDVSGTAFKTQANTTYLGSDKVWLMDNGNSVLVGLFGAISNGKNSGQVNGSKGSTDMYTGGIYGMWQHRSGLFTDLTAQIYRHKSDNDAYTEQGQHTNYDLNSNATSLNLTIGQRFNLNHDFYLEPAIKGTYLHSGGRDFTTHGASEISVTRSSANIMQYGAAIKVGKTINTASTGSIFQPYIGMSLLGQHVNGGEVKSDDIVIDSKLNGYQFQTELGVNWQINTNNRLFAEVSTGAGNKFHNSVGTTIGYRLSF